VISTRLGAGREGSPFFARLPSPAVHFNDTSAIQNVVIDPLQIIREVGGFGEFWTYKGSLTTPPCTEGVQWFIARETLLVNLEQMQDILGASTFAARVEQEVCGAETMLEEAVADIFRFGYMTLICRLSLGALLDIEILGRLECALMAAEWNGVSQKSLELAIRRLNDQQPKKRLSYAYGRVWT